MVPTRTASRHAPPRYACKVSVACQLADLDGDGRLDIAITDQLSGDVSVVPNTPSQPFGSVLRFRAGPGPYGLGQLPDSTVVRSQLGTTGIVAGAFTSDGTPDLIVTNSLLDRFSLLEGDGTGGLFNPISTGGFLTGLHPSVVVAGLLNGDRTLDLAILNEGSSDVSIFAGMARAASRASSPSTPAIARRG